MRKKGKNNDETYSFNTPQKIAENYTKQAKSTYDAVDMFSICEITDGNDYVIEGYHVTPELAAQLIKKYGAENFRVLFLVKSDVEKFVVDVEKSSTPNNWILAKTKNKETFYKIAEMIYYYGEYFNKEAGKYGFEVLNMDEGFEERLEEGVGLLVD